jgi:hypothetical protein
MKNWKHGLFHGLIKGQSKIHGVRLRKNVLGIKGKEKGELFHGCKLFDLGIINVALHWTIGRPYSLMFEIIF